MLLDRVFGRTTADAALDTELPPDWWVSHASRSPDGLGGDWIVIVKRENPGHRFGSCLTGHGETLFAALAEAVDRAQQYDASQEVPVER